MTVKITVTFEDSSYDAELRTLLCDVARRKPDGPFNPLANTPFNNLLKKSQQQAFEAGRDFAEEHPKLKRH